MPDASMALRAGLIAFFILLGGEARSEELAIAVDNQSRSTLCAEEDNVYLRLQSTAVQGLRIEAQHPAYIGTLAVDRTAPDFTHCDGTPPPPGRTFTPRRVTIYEDADWQLVGFTFATFWRTNAVPIRVGDRRETDIHLLQLWTRFEERAEEVLVLYPTDGYWRARPLAPSHLRSTAYGSSFLIGPVEVKDRPMVDIKEVAFDPATRTFTLQFAHGGSATLRVASLDRERMALDVSFTRPIVGTPFAALRSMFVSETNADVAQAAWRGLGERSWHSAPMMGFKDAAAVELRAERVVPSRHNTSAPDMVFGNFSAHPE
jgi:hypothetical protein